jgi:hypothetical protein
MQNRNEAVNIILGILLLIGMHIAAILVIASLGFIVGTIYPTNYSGLVVWLYGAAGFLFWQLLYVIPVSLWLKRRGNQGMMKGVIIGAVITALLNGACFLSFFRF